MDDYGETPPKTDPKHQQKIPSWGPPPTTLPFDQVLQGPPLFLESNNWRTRYPGNPSTTIGGGGMAPGKWPWNNWLQERNMIRGTDVVIERQVEFGAGEISQLSEDVRQLGTKLLSWEQLKTSVYLWVLLLRSAVPMMQSVIKHNLHSESEAAINKLINIKLSASYTYLSLVSPLLFASNYLILQGMYFDRDDVALPNFSHFFLERSVKEREQAESLLEYQNMRGGRILLQSIAKPSREDWKGGKDAISFSLEYQKSLNNSLLDIHRIAGRHTDPHLCDFLESHFLPDSHDAIKKLGDYLSSLTRLTSSEPNGHMGEYLFDKHTL
ncbi:hypothetical protein NFI96_024079 [Prochilodus magdalenae]|nr:hypothetical protein NFI96_024079 [Prochilodus magdalenae]